MVGAVFWIISVFMQHRLNLFGPEAGWLWIVHQLLVFVAIICVMIGFLGLVWGGAVQSRFGKFSVYLYIFSWSLIIFAGIIMFFVQIEDSPVFILFLIFGVLSDVGALLTGLAVLYSRHWSGWQRYIPILNFLIVFINVNLLVYMSANDGPGLNGELIMGACWLGVALAVYTTQSRTVTTHASVAS